MRSSEFSPRTSRRSLLIGGTAFGVLSMSPRRARAAPWPTRPVKLMVPFAAGGTTDILARVVAAKISEEFGQQFVVENKPGAGWQPISSRRPNPTVTPLSWERQARMPSTSSCSRT